MLNALESVVSVLLLILIGVILAKRGWIDERGSNLIARLVVTVALPAYMVANLMGGYDRPKLLAMLPGLPIPVAVMLVNFGLGHALARLLRLPPERRGTFASFFSLSNTIFIGLPVNLVLFGEQSLPYVLLYYIGNTLMFWTIGVHGIARDGAARDGRFAARIVSIEGLKRVLSPPFVAFLGSAALILVGLRLPDFLLDLCKTVGTMTTPLSMIFVGIMVAGVEWRRIKPDLGLALVLVGRFVVSPLLLVLAVRWTELPLLMKQVFFIQAAMPAVTQTPIVARAYGADAEYAGIVTSVTTVASLATIPIYMSVIDLIW